MIEYISLLENNAPKSHKSLSMAYIYTNYKKNLSKITSKGYTYFKINTKDLSKIELIKPSSKVNYRVISKVIKIFEKDTPIYQFLYTLYKKFVYVSFKNETGYFQEITKEYTSKNIKGLRMIQFEVKYYHTNYTIFLNKIQFGKLNLKLNSPVPILRDMEKNIISCDYKEINKLLKNKYQY